MKTNPNPNLFMSLVGGCLALFLALTVFLFYSSFSSYFLLAVIGLICAFGILVLLGLTFTLRRGKTIPGLEVPTLWLINFFYPAAVNLGSLVGIDKDRVRGSFIAIRNRLTRLHSVKADPDQILVLLPHCLQLADCKFKVTTDVNNCRRCGRCVIADILELKARYNIQVVIATGGTIARRQVKEIKPKVVLAVACERDLASGIADIEQIQVYGITNQRPFGPCYNTTVDPQEIERAIQAILE